MTREEAIEILCAYGIPQDEEEFQHALNMAIKALEQTRWIPVSEMPTKSGMYLVTRGIYMDVSEISFIIDVAYWHGHWSRGLVIAWMPLPEPYKAESEDKVCK